MLIFERKFNKEREERDKKGHMLRVSQESHTIYSFFLLFSHFKSSDGNTRQDKKKNYTKDDFKCKCKKKVMNIIWDVNFDDDNNNSNNKVI
jgi:hypothetical protein